LTYRIIGCAQAVHRALGPGFPEAIYHKALAHELARARIPFDSEWPVQVCYDGIICGKFRVDLVVNGKVIVELKALAGLTAEHLAQAISYLKATNLRLALLINFGRKNLEVRRVAL